MKLSTIGFTKKSARRFFDLLPASRVPKRIVDVRLNNESQLAGFAKKDRPRVLSRGALRNGVRSATHFGPDEGDAGRLQEKARGLEDVRGRASSLLMHERRIEETIPQEIIADGCLLCSE